MEQYRVLVVDDSAFMRKIITDLIESDPQFAVIGTATNGIEALTRVEDDKPDVITLDLEMPQMNGIDALQHILKKHKLPVIMLSGISEANTQDTIKALQFGAFDFIRKPTGVGANMQDIHAVGDMLREKLRIAVLIGRRANELAKRTESNNILHKFTEDSPKYEPNLLKNDNIGDNPTTIRPLPSNHNRRMPVVQDKKVDKVEQDWKQKKVELQQKPSKVEKVDKVDKQRTIMSPATQLNAEGSTALDKRHKASELKPLKATAGSNADSVTALIAIGTSTGGPRALHEVICSLPRTLKAPVVIVQHMPPRFTKSLAQRLNSFSELEVCEAEHGMKLENGKAYVAPGGKHMHVTRQQNQYIITIGTEPPRNGHRPSVDVLFESLLDIQELERHIVIMTGMGSDGAKGMKQLAEQGVASTIAEAEESCVVYGMPRSAIELGAASKVLPLIQIGPELVRLLT